LGFRFVGSMAHANTRMGYGWLGERLLISPQFHRAHHAVKSVGRRSCNYGTVFPWWDMLFGTADFHHDTVETGDASAPAAMVTGSWGAQQLAGLQRMIQLGRRRPKRAASSK
jgi:sterol desaturase/sphingolipid hydroxylase (fatty acid hydroxylase superfamily)